MGSSSTMSAHDVSGSSPNSGGSSPAPVTLRRHEPHAIGHGPFRGAARTTGLTALVAIVTEKGAD